MNPEDRNFALRIRRFQQKQLKDNMLKNMVGGKLAKNVLQHNEQQQPAKERLLKKSQVAQLFRLCSLNFVNEYDVQIEIVDHLASDIENQWAGNPELNFKQALKNAVEKFGNDGFYEMKLAKVKSLEKKYNRLLWNFFIRFYSWPKIVFTVFSSWLLSRMLVNMENLYWLMGISFAAMIIFLVWYYFIYFRKNKLRIMPGKQFLSQQYFNGFLNLGYSFLFITWQVFSLIPTAFKEVPPVNRQPWFFLISLVIVALCILIYAGYFVVPKKIAQHFNEQFPQYAN